MPEPYSTENKTNTGYVRRLVGRFVAGICWLCVWLEIIQRERKKEKTIRRNGYEKTMPEPYCTKNQNQYMVRTSLSWSLGG